MDKTLEHMSRRRPPVVLPPRLSCLPLAQPLRVHRAAPIVPETMGKRMIEVVEVEVIGAPRIGPVQERTMVRMVRHLHHYRHWGGGGVNGGGSVIGAVRSRDRKRGD